jgi:ubiquitin-activating enzyme E1
VGDTLKQYSSNTEEAQGGRARQVKQPREMAFKSLAEALAEPALFIWDYAKFETPAQLHALWQALYKFEQKV